MTVCDFFFLGVCDCTGGSWACPLVANTGHIVDLLDTAEIEKYSAVEGGHHKDNSMSSQRRRKCRKHKRTNCNVPGC